jgi:alpha-glucosidase
MNSNGMDVILRDGSLEYNVIGGILDFYFISGPSPVKVAQQYATLVGKPAEVPYWGFGFHQCRWGYRDYVDVANVITNYSAAGIPLETMWTDIDYMYKRWTFTNDPEYFPTEKMHQITDYLHKHNQQYIVMIDPAVAYQPNQNYGAYDRGVQDGVFLKFPNGTLFQGVVWPGPTVFPDWFHPKATQYWTGEIERFFDPKTGIDIDGLWIDMNEAANFCDFPCADPAGFAATAGNPPPRPAPPPANGTPIFQKRQASSTNSTSSTENLLNPPYAIHNALDQLSQHTIRTDLIHANGLNEYDTHNLYGFMMSVNSQKGMEARRPGKRTLVITRSTFVGAGTKVGKWLGDNLSTWDHYRWSISGQLGMASIYQIPMVGSDICGFGGNTTETLCARWATLGAFSPFMRNHNGDTSISQEFYRWPTVAEAAKKAIAIRYQLLDYIYTHFHRQSIDGTPLIGPMWFQYPTDQNTYPIDLQFFYGDSLLVSPVTQENSTSVDIYLPKDTFYNYFTLAPVQGAGAKVSLTNVNFTDIPLHIRGGGILPMRVESAMTTAALRQKDFQIVVAPNASGTATGYLYIDDGVSSSQTKTTDVTFQYAKGTLKASGKFNYNVGSVKVAKVIFLGVKSQPKSVSVSGSGPKSKGFKWDAATSTVTVNVEIPLKGAFSVTMK